MIRIHKGCDAPCRNAIGIWCFSQSRGIDAPATTRAPHLAMRGPSEKGGNESYQTMASHAERVLAGGNELLLLVQVRTTCPSSCVRGKGATGCATAAAP